MPARPQRKKNGDFAKGYTPFNKGRKWSEWMSKEGQEKTLNVLKNCKRHVVCGWNKREVIMYNPKTNKWRPFDSCAEAGRAMRIQRRNINACVVGKRLHAGGYWWFDANTNWPKIVEARTNKQ